MNLYPPPETEIKTIGFSGFCEVNNHTFKRKRGTTEWTAVDTMNAPEECDCNLQLLLVRHDQAPVQILDSESLKDIYFIALVTEKQAAIVKQIADQEPPPRAARRKEEKENCQGWVIRVLSRLVEKGFVDRAKLEMAKSMEQPTQK
ncbi:hypothetical protein LOZ58_001228 [Ophidiomyces ophidiicola]|nr:hypothetical protein LOZ58_001228 [Ophidiomyces ophidiicola]